MILTTNYVFSSFSLAFQLYGDDRAHAHVSPCVNPSDDAHPYGHDVHPYDHDV